MKPKQLTNKAIEVSNSTIKYIGVSKANELSVVIVSNQCPSIPCLNLYICFLLMLYIS